MFILGEAFPGSAVRVLVSPNFPYKPLIVEACLFLVISFSSLFLGRSQNQKNVYASQVGKPS